MELAVALHDCGFPGAANHERNVTLCIAFPNSDVNVTG